MSNSILRKQTILTGGPGSRGQPVVEASASLLLDAYPSAYFAYSFRKLRTAFAGSAVRIRAASESGGDNAETDVGFSGNNFNSAAVSSFIGTHGGVAKITTWYDQSGGGLDGTQPSAGQQPAYSTSPDILFFDSASSQRFQVNSADLQATPWTLTSQINQPSASSGGSLMGSGFNGGPQWQVDNGRAIYLVKQDTSTVANTSAGAYSADVLQHLAVSYDAANYAFYVQGSSAGSGSASTTFTSVLRQDIGGSGNSIFFKGYMSEFVVWRSILSSGTIAAIKAGYY